jgi:hypothetical protein
MKSSPKGYEMKYIGSHEISPGKEWNQHEIYFIPFARPFHFIKNLSNVHTALLAIARSLSLKW